MKRIVLAAIALVGCDQAEHPATLYRNSPTSISRIHVATFDANESSRLYNLDNCGMAARLYNANFRVINPNADKSLGFWCEPGRYSDKGPIPLTFNADFPTDTP